MMHATSIVTEKPEMTSRPKVTKINREVMASYSGLSTIIDTSRSTNYYCS